MGYVESKANVIERFRYHARLRGYLRALKWIGHQSVLDLLAKFQRRHIRRTPFFSRHQYKGGHDIKTIDNNVILDFELGFFYNRIQKVANSYTCLALSKMKYGKDTKYDSEKVKSEYFLHPSQLDGDQVEMMDDLYKFVLVRNPYTRVLSAYLDKIVNREWETNSYRRRYFPSEHHRPTFDEFVDALDQGLLYANKHWTPQASLLALPVGQFDLVGKLENYGKNFREIERHLESQVSDVEELLDRTHRDINTGHSTSAREQAGKYYSSNTRDKVARLYQRDFNIFDYPTDELP